MGEFSIVGLRVVREAVRHGSFSVAAERLGYTQSAVSRQIALMERAAGQALFQRQARGVQPTAAGRIVARHADAVLGELHATQQDLQDLLTRPPARLRVGAFSSAMTALVPRATAALLQSEPGIQVPLREGLTPSLLTSVARGRLDLAVITLPKHLPDGVEVIRLLDDPLLVAVPSGHPLAGGASVTAADLRKERWIAGGPGPGSPLLGAWTDASWQPKVAFVVRDWIAKIGLVSAGLGITIVPGLAVPALPDTIAVVRIADPEAVRTTAIAHRADRPHDRHGEAFIRALRETATALSTELQRRLRHRGFKSRRHRS